MKMYGLSDYDAGLLTETRQIADYFEEAVKIKPGNMTAKTIANWLINRDIDISSVLPVQLIVRIKEAKENQSLPQADLENVIRKTLTENVRAVDDYKNGKEQALMFLVGQTMSKLKGKGTASVVLETIKKLLS